MFILYLEGGAGDLSHIGRMQWPSSGFKRATFKKFRSLKEARVALE